MSKFRSFCFTWNNFTNESIETCKALKYQYLILGDEIAPTTGTPHIQGYVYLTSQQTLSSFIKKLKGAHIDVCKGSPEANQAYCSKSKILFEDGSIPAQGKRTDIDDVRDEIAAGGQVMTRVTATGRSYQAMKACSLILVYHEPKRHKRPKVYWYYGPTGTGKSHAAEHHPMVTDPYFADSTSRWWDGYDGHETIIIDDFRSTFCTFEWLLKLLDKKPLRLECKGGSRQCQATRIFITCPFHPSVVFDNDEDMKQLTRRLYKVVNMVTPYVEPPDEFSDSEAEDE